MGSKQGMLQMRVEGDCTTEDEFADESSEQSPNIMDPSSLSDYYGSLYVHKTRFFDNVINTRLFGFKLDWGVIGKPVDRSTWYLILFHPILSIMPDELQDENINSTFLWRMYELQSEFHFGYALILFTDYGPQGNEIVIPAGVMQFPVFHEDFPSYLTYGAFGSVAGHELSHAFDSGGRYYDENGNYTDWWDSKTVAAFNKRAHCFVDQFSQYTVDGPDGLLHIDGQRTLGENIADTGGLTSSYLAWKRRSKILGKEADLPGLEFFTHDQLFFINFGNLYCGKYTKERLRKYAYADSHSPPFIRVIGGIANSKDFKKSFNCPVKEPICHLW
jgi:endothelin-converting enzyme